MAYCVVVVALSTLPLNGFSTELNNVTIITFRGDYFFHCLMYSPFLMLASTLRISSLLKILVLGLILATSMEYIQYLLPYRTFNINDLLANVIGVMLGFLPLWIYNKMRYTES